MQWITNRDYAAMSDAEKAECDRYAIIQTNGRYSYTADEWARMQDPSAQAAILKQCGGCKGCGDPGGLE